MTRTFVLLGALECVAAGAIPVTTDIGAMKTTVKKTADWLLKRILEASAILNNL